MAEFKRYQRSEAVNPGSVSLAGANSWGSLSDRLANFANNQSQRADQEAAFEGEKAGQSAGAGTISGVQLQDDQTIRGRAFNKGALMSHAAQIQIDVRSDIANFFRENKNNVHGFDAKVEELKKGMLGEVDPTLRPHVENEINDYASRSRSQIQDNVFTQNMTEYATIVTDAVVGMKEDALQAARLGDAEMMAKKLGQIQAIYEEGIKDGVLDPSKIAAEQAVFDEEIDKWIVIGLFDPAIKGGDLEALEKQYKSLSDAKSMDAFLKDIGLEPDEDNPVELRPDTVESIKSHIRGEISRLASEKNKEASLATAQRRAQTDQSKDFLDDFNQSLDNGFLPNVETLDLAIKNAEGTEWEDELLAVKEYVNDYQPFIVKDIEAQKNDLAEKRREKDLTGDQAANISRLEKVHAATIERSKEDGLTLFYEQGLTDHAPIIDIGLRQTDPEKFYEDVQKNKWIALQASIHYGVDVAPITNQQASELAHKIKNSDMDSQKTILAAVVGSYGNKAPEVMAKMFADDASPYAAVGGLMLQNDDISAIAAQEILLGIDVLTNHQNIIPKEFEELANNIIGNTYAAGFNTKQHKIMLEAARAMYAQELAQSGRFGKASATDNIVDEEVLQNVFKKLVGGYVDIEFQGSSKNKQLLDSGLSSFWDDTYRIEAPARGMDDSAVEKWMKSITAADIDAMGGVQGMDSAEVAILIKERAVHLVSAGDGKYKVNTLPGNSLTNTEGSAPFILDYSIKTTPVDGIEAPTDASATDISSAAYDQSSLTEEPIADDVAIKTDETVVDTPNITAQKELIDQDQEIGLFTVPEEVSPIDDKTKTYEQKQKEQDQKTLEYAKQNRKLKLKQTTGGKSEAKAFPIVQSNTRKILSFIKGDGENPKAELDQINEYLANTSGDHPWDVLFNEADTNISAGLMRDLKKSQVKKITKRKEAILKAHPEWKDKAKKEPVKVADNKILTDISGMKTKAQVNALKSHTDNILKQINWEAKTPKNITPAQEVKLMREELKLIKQYFAAANDEETHAWDEIFSIPMSISTSNSSSDADNEANEMLIELADEYLEMQFDILADRKKELQKALR